MPKGAFQNGVRLHDPSKDKLWLVINGKCHHISSNEVYCLLFKPRILIKEIDQSADLRFGEPLIFGTCLVRTGLLTFPDLLAVYSNKVILHKIAYPQIADKYGLDFSLARLMPAEILKGIPKGRLLE